MTNNQQQIGKEENRKGRDYERKRLRKKEIRKGREQEKKII